MSWIEVLIIISIVFIAFVAVILFSILKSASDADDRNDEIFREEMRKMSMKMRREHERYKAEER